MTNESIPPAMVPAPTAVPPQPKSRKKLWITAGVVGGILLIGGIGAAARGGDDRPATTGQQEAPATQTEVELVTVPDVVGQTVDAAQSALESAGFRVVIATDSEGTATVLSTDPAGSSEAEAGSNVRITAEERPQLTLAQENAIEKAESYLSFMAFSRTGLIGQLEFEGFTTEEATFAVDYLAVDWNAQAAEKAQEYLDSMAFSRQGLIDQLIFEGFSQAEAEFGVAAVGY